MRQQRRQYLSNSSPNGRKSNRKRASISRHSRVSHPRILAIKREMSVCRTQHVSRASECLPDSIAHVHDTLYSIIFLELDDFVHDIENSFNSYMVFFFTDILVCSYRNRTLTLSTAKWESSESFCIRKKRKNKPLHMRSSLIADDERWTNLSPGQKWAAKKIEKQNNENDAKGMWEWQWHRGNEALLPASPPLVKIYTHSHSHIHTFSVHLIE